VADIVDAASERIELQRALSIGGIRRGVSRMGLQLCCDCGIEIPAERLKALPSARRCICCQEEHEGR